MTTDAIVRRYYEGRKDGWENKPKQVRGLNKDQKKAYLNGYAEGTQDRSREGELRKKPLFDFHKKG